MAGVMDPGELGRAINHVAFAAATDDSRPVLAGIKVEITGEDYTFAAADGFRLAVYKGKMEGAAPEDLDFIIPARTLQEVNRLLSGQVHPIEFTVTPNKNQAMFRLDNVGDRLAVDPGHLPQLQPVGPHFIRNASCYGAVRVFDGQPISSHFCQGRQRDSQGCMSIRVRTEMRASW